MPFLARIIIPLSLFILTAKGQTGNYNNYDESTGGTRDITANPSHTGAAEAEKTNYDYYEDATTSMPNPLQGHQNSTMPSNSDRLLQQLLATCPYLSSYQKPVRKYDHYMDVTVYLALDRLIGIDSTAATMSMLARIDICWTYPSCARWDDSDEFKDVWLLFVPLSQNGVYRWTPKILVRNSADNANVLIQYINQNGWLFINPDGQACVQPYGRIVTSCPLGDHLVKFPFDMHTCTIELEDAGLEYNTNYINLGYNTWSNVTVNNSAVNASYRLELYVPTNFIDEDSVWELLDIGYSDGEYVSYSLVVKRRPGSYMYNIILPCILLMFLQLAAFAIPPRHPERPAFSITVVLAFYILQTLLAQSIPETTKTLYIIQYLACQLTLGVIITIYLAIINHFADELEFKQKRIFTSVNKRGGRVGSANSTGEAVRDAESSQGENTKGVHVIRIADSIAFGITILVMIIYNAVIFAKMTAVEATPTLPEY